MKLHLDFETRSRVDLKKVGPWAYAMHPSTDVVCIGWSAPDDGKIIVDKSPRCAALLGYAAAIAVHPDNGVVISAHNAAFEYAIYNLILHRRYGWPAIWEASRWSCTMARALACGLPADLDFLGRVLQIKTPKDLDGRKAMLRACKPLADGTFDESPELYARIYAYNAVDVQAEMEVDALLPELSPAEQKVWELDLEMNRRGVRVDLDLCRKAADLSDRLISGLNAQLLTKTKGAVDKATQVQALKYYLSDAHGVATETLDKESVTDLMADPTLPEEAREILHIRRQVGKKNSIAKYKAALEMACPDGRVRGLLQYHAAHTGRWGGRGLQPQNFPKGYGVREQNAAIEVIKRDGVGVTTDMLSDSLRGLFISSPGRIFACADFNAIEARVLFWEAGIPWTKSPYLDMAQTIYPRQELSKEKTPIEYDIGKRTILGAGYGMGPEKFKDNIYAETAKKGKAVVVSKDLAERAIAAYRDKYAAVPELWRETEGAAVAAVLDGRRAFPCAGGRVQWGMTTDRRFLACRLPSGRYLRYWRPSVEPKKTPWGDMKKQLHYWAVDSVTKQWSKQSTYGGSLVENITQAIARDLLVNGLMNVSAAGYEALLTVHDEVVAEVAPDRGNLEEFIALLCKTPPWAEGCAVAAEGWMGGRYHK